MALTPETSTALVPEFRGSSQSVDPYALDSAHGLLSQNVDFILGQPGASGAIPVQAATRRGSSEVAQIPAAAHAITTLASWYFSFAGTQNGYVAMYSPSIGLLFYDQSTATFSGAIIAVTGAAYASVVFDGLRAYVAFGDFTGRKGISQGYVYGLFANNTFTNPAADKLFFPPFQQGDISSPPPGTIFFEVGTTLTAGVTTKGTHNFGYIVTTRNGYTGSISPVTVAGVFSPFTYAASTDKQLNALFVWNSLPSYVDPDNAPFASVIQVVMTSASNLQEYYVVPGATATIPTISIGTVTITFNISDADLVTGTNVTQLQNLFTQDQSGAGPFNPSAIFLYSSRVGYVTLDPSGFPVVFFSDVNAYQILRLADSGIYLEGRKIPVQGCSLGGVCYIATLDALYAVQDNGGVPATWAQPARVAGSIGIPAPSCMKAVGGKLLMASEKGLYVYYGGTFPQIPISYWQNTDWNRINWLQPTQVQVIDDAFDHVIRVIAPLKVLVTAASNTGTITITTAILINNVPVAYPHNFQTGLNVTIAGVLGNTNANTTAAITVTGLNTFTIPVAGNGAYTSGGVVTPNSPNAEMSWAYPEGDAPGMAFYSLNAFTSFRQASIATVRNILTNQDEPWYGPASSNPGNIIRRVLPTDSLIHRDVNLSGTATAINSLYETSLAPGQADDSMTVRDYAGMHARISGSGALAITAYGLDHVVSVVPLASPMTLNSTPGKEYLLKWFLRSEQQSILFGTNAVDAYFIAALLRVYYQGSLPQR